MSDLIVNLMPPLY